MQRVKLKQIGISQDDRAAEEQNNSGYSKEILPSGDEEGTPNTDDLSLDKIKEKLTKNALLIGLAIGAYVIFSESQTGSGITVVK